MTKVTFQVSFQMNIPVKCQGIKDLNDLACQHPGTEC